MRIALQTPPNPAVQKEVHEALIFFRRFLVEVGKNEPEVIIEPIEEVGEQAANYVEKLSRKNKDLPLEPEPLELLPDRIYNP